MAKKTFEPPKCPECGANLFRVGETNLEVYRFNPETGRYKADDGEAEMFCLDCDADLYDVFPDGVCNYDAMITSVFPKCPNCGEANGFSASEGLGCWKGKATRRVTVEQRG